MSSDEKTFYHLRYLLCRSLDGQITEEQVRQLDRLIVENPQARRYYVEFLQIHTHLRQLLEHTPAACSSEEILDAQLWQLLAQHEQTAELVPIKRPDAPALCDADRAVQPVRRPPVSRLSLIGAALSIAAILFIVIYARFFASPAVATLTDAVNARWAYGQSPLEAGERVSVRPCDLVSGFVSIQFDSGVNVVLEGPAQFKLISENQMRLFSGKVFAAVPNTAIGFVVDCPGSRVVDLGTQFGLEVKPAGTAEVHVMKGKVNLVAGTQGSPQVSKILQQSQACRVEPGGQIQPVEFKELYFARKISSEDKTVWYGQTHLNLADLAAGGSGLGHAQTKAGIDPASGQVHAEARQGYSRSGAGGYHRVPSRPFVDGVFVPNGDKGPVQVTSEGHTFSGFPFTAGEYWSDIMTQPIIYTGRIDDNQELLKAQPMEVSLEPSKVPSSVLVLHSNAGITFDLDAVRRQYPTLRIVRFTARCGVSANALAQMANEFWVLVDGRVRFHHLNPRGHAVIQTLDIEIRPDERFLTLATTDGGDNISYDWCLFENPILELRGRN
ncbi:MAG TPA: NPCBM/NEW2 domain-containing protein [Anaerohalosphaeraceae bacterium]|nr:NPCBM/NEW2 domain-containing protein [Anaerohalosphaeraceae bacterium]HPB93559.1 NPCBM/NEW2 domain-containing protein [Anaerohalosphaeraceae bacterium]HRT23880.1 NPCBM/NEW2 domain-containing protein [Anaerohalosphaeraceae bacterium]